MGEKQKISRHVINMASDSTKIKYLLSLNSVFDISKSRISNGKTSTKNHIFYVQKYGVGTVGKVDFTLINLHENIEKW